RSILALAEMTALILAVSTAARTVLERKSHHKRLFGGSMMTSWLSESFATPYRGNVIFIEMSGCGFDNEPSGCGGRIGNGPAGKVLVQRICGYLSSPLLDRMSGYA